MTPRFGFLVCGCFLLAPPTFAQGVDRRPCVNPGAPSGCDATLKGAPLPNTSFPDGPPLPEQRDRQSLARIPLSPPPIGPSTSGSTSGEVSVKPVPAEAQTPALQPRVGIGPPAPAK